MYDLVHVLLRHGAGACQPASIEALIVEEHTAERAGVGGVVYGREVVSDSHEYWPKTASPACVFESSDARLADIWVHMRDGKFAVQQHFVAQDSCSVVLAQRSEVEAREHRLSAAQSDVLLRLVGGQRQKAVAIDLNLSPAAITFRAQRCMQRLGLHCKPSYMPLFVVLAAIGFSRAAAKEVAHVIVERYDWGSDGAALYRLKGGAFALPPILSSAEREIAKMFVAGLPPAMIARQRKTTVRTVLNQLRSIFGKFGVSGRLELIARLSRGSTATSLVDER